jgi:prepilin-type N-terminal cleavage/methylation domain-containing protein
VERRGVTLMEMLVVVTLVALAAGLSYPVAASGLESLRLSSAADSLAGFLNTALVSAERRQQAIELTIAPRESAVRFRGLDPASRRELLLADGVRIRGVLPETTLDPGDPRRYLLYPGGAPPRLGILLENRRGARRLVQLDPVTGVPAIERVEPR